jgi:RHS repeat-associated protein
LYLTKAATNMPLLNRSRLLVRVCQQLWPIAFLRRLARLAGFALALVMSLSMVGKASAQAPYPPPPIFSAVDERGVDLLSGQIKFQTPSISIGEAGAGGLSYTGTYDAFQYRDNLTGTITTSGSGGASRTVSIGFSAESFAPSGSNWISSQGTGATLSFNATAQEWTYTLPDGSVAKFSRTLGLKTGLFGPNEGLITSLTAPNGEITTFNYRTAEVVQCNGNPCSRPFVVLEELVRLQSVSNNLGYQIHFEYKLDTQLRLFTNQDYGQYLLPKSVIAFNLADAYCAPGAMTCAPAGTWPKLTFATTDPFWFQVTDALGRTTQSAYTSNTLSYTPPGLGSPVISATINATTFRVSSVAVGANTWSYTYADASGQRTTTTLNPGGSSRNMVSSLTTGLPVSQTNELGKTTSMQHDANGRLTQLTYPEGNQVRYAYDGRGNVTELKQVAKSGSGLSDLVQTASYPSSCSNPVTCNQPDWTRDTAGQQTDYTYDSVHGGLLTVTSPAATSGADRPQQRFAYTQMYAWYRQTPSGSPAQAPTQVWRLTQTSACSSGVSPGCVGTVNESRTTIAYGTTGVGNNRVALSITAANGTGSVTSTTSRTLTPVSDTATLDGPLSGTADTNYFFYDSMRNPLGVISPDPDGGGSLLRRAVKMNYNSSGLVASVDQGTATGIDLSALNAMSAIQRSETDFDALLRPVASRLKAGSTTLALQQVSYDARGRVDCEVVRMNSATFGSPPGACTLGTTGSAGPDRISKYTYDNASQILEVTGAYGTAQAGPDVRYTYTNNGLQETVRDETGNRTTYVFDGFDRVSKLRYPDPSSVGTSSTTDYHEYSYNPVGRMSAVRIRSGQSIAMTYDNLGRLTTRTPPSGQPAVAYSYDLLSRMTSATQTGHSVSFTFDALGRQLTEVSPQGTMTYQYDVAGRRTRATWPDSFYVDYDYDVTGAVTAIRENGATSGSGVLATYAYDNLGRLVSISRGNGVSSAMTYNASLELQSIGHDLASTSQDQVLSFTYNRAGQILTRAMTNNIYQYSGLSNLDNTFTVNGLNQYVTGGGASFVYGLRGNLANDGTRTYNYDFDNRLTEVTGVGGAVALSYDPAGRLYQTAQTGGGTTRFLYDGANLAAEYDGSNVLQKRYVQGSGLDNSLVAYAGSGSGSKLWLITDERGSIIAETDASGAAVQINSYDEYGIPKSGNNGRFGFTGQLWIAEIDAYSYRNRIYNQKLGVFLQTDPIGLAGGLNLYAYVFNDPVNLIDPWGFNPFECENRPDGTRVCGKVTVTAPRRDPPLSVTTRLLLAWNSLGGISGSATSFGSASELWNQLNQPAPFDLVSPIYEAIRCPVVDLAGSYGLQFGAEGKLGSGSASISGAAYWAPAIMEARTSLSSGNSLRAVSRVGSTAALNLRGFNIWEAGALREASNPSRDVLQWNVPDPDDRVPIESNTPFSGLSGGLGFVIVGLNGAVGYHHPGKGNPCPT